MKQPQIRESTKQILTKILPYFLRSTIFYTILLPIINYSMQPYFNQNKLFIKSWHPFAYATNHDAMHYIHNQYEWQMNYAFLPAYVIFLKILRSVSNCIISDEQHSRILFVSLAVLVNKLIILLSAIQLYRIAKHINQKYALNAVILFLFNPASVFFHSMYTQPLCCLLTFWAVAQTLDKNSVLDEPYEFIKNNRVGLLLFFLSTTVRSTCQFYAIMYGFGILKGILISRKDVEKMIRIIITGAIVLMVFSIVMVMHNHIGYMEYCLNGHSWFCSSTVPNIYSSVQEKYWRVGFMKFFRMDEMGAWAVGLPTILVALLTNRKHTGDDGVIGLNWSYGFMQFIMVFMSYVGSSVRFMSTQPLFYINAALCIDRHSKLSKVLVAYWIIYNILGLCIYGASGAWY